MIQEIEAPGKTKYRVFNRNGALIYHGIRSRWCCPRNVRDGEREELDAREARETRSRRSSD